MKKSIFTILALATALTTQAFASNDTCTSLAKENNTLIKNSTTGMNAYKDGERIFIQFCSEFRINSECEDILDLMSKKLPSKAFYSSVDPILTRAYSYGEMSAREANAFSGLVETMYSGIMTNIYSLRKTGPIQKKMTEMKCSEVASLTALTDTALISASKQGKTGVCTVVSVKGGKFKVLVKGQDYPLEGITYPTMPELAQGLKEALDAGLCL